MSGTADGAVREAAQRFLARHYRVMASAVNVGDWQAYIRVCAAAQENGSAWFDDEALAELLAVVADTTAGEADCGCGGTGIRKFDSDGYEACPVHLLPLVAARSGGAQDDGLRARVAALAGDFDANGNSRALGDPSAAAWHKAAELRRRALAGPDDTQQDGAR